MDFLWTDEQRELRVEAAALARTGVERFGAHTDAWMNGYSREFSMLMAQHGFLGMSWPKEFGGQDRSALDRFIVNEEMLKVGAPVAASWFADRQVGPALIAFGTTQQQIKYLPDIVAGVSTWAIGMSEPGAGSDVASLRTSACRSRDAYIVSGQKTWTSFASVADYCYLICRTSRDGSPHEGISELIVPMASSGITIRPIPDMAGGHHFCEVYFDDVEVPVENLVGTEGAAFGQTMRQLEHERGGVDRLLSNRLLYDLALRVADRDDPYVRRAIAEIEIDYHAGRLMVIREALRQGPSGFSAVTKYFCTSHEKRVADFVWRVLYAHSLRWDAVGRGLCYSPSYGIMGGTNEILLNIVGERMLGLPRESRLAG